MTHFHVERVRKTGMSEFTERVGNGAAYATAAEAQVYASRGDMLTPGDVLVRVSDPCNCPAPLEPESATRLLDSLHERVQAIEARQRAYGMHDPSCAGRELGSRDDCDCWLSM